MGLHEHHWQYCKKRLHNQMDFIHARIQLQDMYLSNRDSDRAHQGILVGAQKAQ